MGRVAARRRATTSRTTCARCTSRSRTRPGAPVAYAAEHTEAAFLTGEVLDYVDGGRPSPWFAHAAYIRPHPPFVAPGAVRTMYDPADRPGPGAARRRSRPRARCTRCSRARSLIPGLRGPDDDAGAPPAARDLLRDDGRGRRAARPAVRRAARARRVGRHARRAHVGSRRAARRPLAHREARLVRPELPRAADRPRPATRVRRDAWHGRRPTVHRERRRDADDPRVARRCDAPVQCDGASLLAARARRRARRLARRGALGVGLPRPDRSAARRRCSASTIDQCALAVLRDEHGKYVHFAGMPPLFYDLDARSRRARRTAPTIRRTRPRCSTTRSGCCRGGWSTPSRRSPASW